MASTTDGCCLNDPNFAVICSFISNFGDKLILPEISFEDLQESLEDTKTVSDLLVDLHVHLLRRIGKKVTIEKWQRSVVKFCHYFDNADAWEIEQSGYEKAKISTKLKVLKNLLETQFDLNLKFKEKITELDPTELRLQPLGRDINGGSYWYLIDKDLNVRIYRGEHPTLKEDEVWKIICRDRDDLAALVATLDAEINPHTEDKIQDPKVEESTKAEENEKEEIVKQEEQQNDLGSQSEKTVETDKLAGVESSSVKDAQIKTNSDYTSNKSNVTISNCTEEEVESKTLVKSIIEDSCVKVEPQEDIPKSTEHVKQEVAEDFKKKEKAITTLEDTHRNTSENEDKIPKSLENEERIDINKDNPDSITESKAEKRKLEFSEETEVESKSRKECSDHFPSGAYKSSASHSKSEKISETVSKETTSANFRRESVIKIGKRIDKIIPSEEGAKQNSSENKDVSPQNQLTINIKQEKEIIKNDDVVVITDPDKDIEKVVKNEEVKKRMNEINNSPDCYKLSEKINLEMSKNLQYIDDENFDDKIVLMKEYTKDVEQMNICKERVLTPASVRNKPHAVSSEDKVQNVHDVNATQVEKTSDSDKIQAENSKKSETKKSSLEEKVNKVHFEEKCAEYNLSKKCNSEKADKGSYSENNESKENVNILSSCKKGNDSHLQKASEVTQKDLNIEKNKGHNSEKEPPNDDYKQLNVENSQNNKKHLKLDHKTLTCDQNSSTKHKSESSDKESNSQNKANNNEKESVMESKSYCSEKDLDSRSKPYKSEKELVSVSKPQDNTNKRVIENISCSREEQPVVVSKPGDKKGEVITKSTSHGSKGNIIDAEIKLDSNEPVAKSKPSSNEEKVYAESKLCSGETVSSNRPCSNDEKTNSGNKSSSNKEKEVVEKRSCGSEEKSSTKSKSHGKEVVVAKSKPCDSVGKTETKSSEAITKNIPSSQKEKSYSNEEEAVAENKPSSGEEKSVTDNKSYDSKEEAITKNRLTDKKEKSGADSKTCSTEEESVAKSKSLDSTESKENSGAESKSCSSNKVIAKGKPLDREKLGADKKSCGSKEVAVTKSRPLESKEKSEATKSKSIGRREKEAVKSSYNSGEKSSDGSVSQNNEEEEGVSKSRSCVSEKEKKESVTKSRLCDTEEELTAGNTSQSSKEEPSRKSRSLDSKAKPGGESTSLGSQIVEPGKKCNKKEQQSKEETTTRSTSGSRDKPLNTENKSLDNDKTEKLNVDSNVNKKSAERTKSENILPSDESDVINTNDQCDSFNKEQSILKEEISAGNEEKKLTCKIVIKRKSHKKDCGSGTDADEVDGDLNKIAKNKEDDVEYKCELGSVLVDDKGEESENVSEKNDGKQRVRKRKACDKLTITPSPKNDRKTAEDLNNEENLEHIQNDDKDALPNANKNLNSKLESKEGCSDTEEGNVRSTRILRPRRTRSSGLETEQKKTELSKVKKTEANSGQTAAPENETLLTKKTRARRRTQAELICTDLIIPEEEKRTRRKRQNTSVEEGLSVGETLEEIEPKKIKGSKNFRKSNTSRLKDTEEQFSSQSDSDDMPLSKMTKVTTRGRTRGRGRNQSSRQPFTVLEESVLTAPCTRKSTRAAKKKEFESNDFDTSHVKSHNGTEKSIRSGSSTAGKGSRSRQRKKRSGSVESDKWVSDKTEGEDEDDDDEEEEELFVGELLRRSSRVRSLGTKNKLLCVSTSSEEEKSETNEDTSDEEFQLPKGRNARRAAARSAAIKEAQKIEDENDKPCCHCQKYDRPETILLCDKCDAGYHTLCLTPPLHIIPEGDWFCPPCEHKMLLEKLTTNLHELDLQLKKRERLMKRKERLAFVGISLDNILSEKKENMEPNVDCPNQSSTTRTCRARRSINYKFTEFDELIDSAIQDDLSTVIEHDVGGVSEDREDSNKNGKDMSNINSVEGPVSRGKDIDTIMTAYSEANDLRPQGIQAKKEAGRRRGKDISNLVGKGSDSDEQYPAPRKRRPKRKLTTLDSDSYASESDEYKASEDSDASIDMDASEYSEEEEDDDDDEDYGIRRRSTRTSTRQTYRASRKYGRGSTRRCRRQRFDDFVVDDDYDSEESANYRRSTRASVKRKVNYREKASDEEEEMTPTEDESEESSAEFSGLGSDDSVEPIKKLKLKLAKKKTKRIIRDSLSEEDEEDDKSSRSSESGTDDKSQKKITRKRRLAVSDSDSSSSSQSESRVRRSGRASIRKINFKKFLDSDSDEEFGRIERPYTVTKLKKNAILSDSDSIASDDKSSIKSISLDKKDNDSKSSYSAGAANDDANNIAIVTPTITADTTLSTTTATTATTTTTPNNNDSHETCLKEDQQSDDNTADSSFSQMNGHDNEKKAIKETHLEKTENRTIATELHPEDDCKKDSNNDDTSNLGTSTSRSGPQVHP